jgi:hypothetical protein
MVFSVPSRKKHKTTKHAMGDKPKADFGRARRERRRRNATNPSVRKAVEKAPAPAPAAQLAVPSYKAVYVPIDDINVDLAKRRPVIRKWWRRWSPPFAWRAFGRRSGS